MILRHPTTNITARFKLTLLLIIAILSYIHAFEPIASDDDPSSSSSIHPIHTSTQPPLSAAPLVLTKERAKSLIDQEIFPQLIPVAPPTITKLGWNDLRISELGAVLTPHEVHERPKLNYNIHANRFYTVFMIDPDAPSRAQPIFGEWLHWLVLNIPGKDFSRADVIVEYVGAAPPEGSGKHRYIIMVYEQSKKIPIDSLTKISRTTGSGRSKWNMERFLQDHDPQAKLVSINYFLAEYDSYVPTIYQQLRD